MREGDGSPEPSALGGPAAGAPPVDPADAQFSTTHLTADLRGRSLRGGLVTLAIQPINFVLQLGSTMILARLLTPADYGLLAMVVAVTGFVALFQDMGLTFATVQRAHITHRQASTLFWINVGVSVGLVALVALLGPLLASFYDEPRLVGITLGISITFLLGGLSAQHLALLRRQMRFQALALMNLAALSASVATAIGIAWRGGGYWALVGALVAQIGTLCVLSIALSRWRPGLPRRGTRVRDLLAFGANVTGFNILNYIGRSASHVLLGWYWGPAPTGLYTKAYSLLMLPLLQVNDPLTHVAVPVLSRLQDDPERYRRYYYHVLSALAYVTAPLIVMMGVLAEDMILFFYGGQWIEASGIFMLLAVAVIFQPILYTAGWVWTSLGRTAELLRWSMLTAPVFVASFAVGLPWGPRGVALSYAVAVNLITPLGLAWCYRGTAMRLAGAVAATWRAYVLSGAMGAAALLARTQVDGLPVAGRLAVSSFAALAVAAVGVAAWPNVRREALDIVRLVKSSRSSASESPVAGEAEAGAGES